MDSNREKLTEIRKLVRTRFERDLRSLIDVSHKRKELTQADLLDELHIVYVHYLKLDAIINNAGACIDKTNPKLVEELRRLRSIDQ